MKFITELFGPTIGEAEATKRRTYRGAAHPACRCHGCYMNKVAVCPTVSNGVFGASGSPPDHAWRLHGSILPNWITSTPPGSTTTICASSASWSVGSRCAQTAISWTIPHSYGGAAMRLAGRSDGVRRDMSEPTDAEFYAAILLLLRLAN